ncbi:MAG: metal-sensing transcriptional repressor [Bacilli bacterium]
MEKENDCQFCHEKKNTPRTEEDIRNLKNRLNRLIGQLSGVAKMLDDNRYCADILIQISACERALQEIGYQILQNHLDTCVREDIVSGKDGIIDETMSLIRKIK